jgi:hypothetical protein
MARDGSGTYSLPEAAFVNGTTIDATAVNSDLSDIASALTQSMAKDGQTTPTANQPMAGYKHTGVGAATARTDYARASQIADNSMVYAVDTGAADAYAIAPAPGITAYAVGQRFDFKVINANLTTTPTLNVNAVGAGVIKWPDGTALAAGDLPANALVTVLVAAATPVFHLQTVALPAAATYMKKASNLSDVASVPTARANLKIDQRVTVANAAYTVLTTDTYVAYTSIAAARTVTLPAASTVPAGRVLTIADESGSASTTNTISLAPNGTDTIDGSNTTQVVINQARGSAVFVCDGNSKWIPLKFSVIYTNTLSGDVALNNTGNYFTGPTVSQGTVGRWMASGAVDLNDSAGAAGYSVKLWDGTTVISSTYMATAAVNETQNIHLSGYIASPAGDIKLSARDASSTSGVIKYNASGNSNDSTLTVWRIP